MKWGPLSIIKRLVNAQRGFTLVEVLVAVGITMAIGSVLVGAIYQMTNITSRGSAHLDTEVSARTAMLWLSRDFRRAWTTDLVDGDPPVSCAAIDPDPCVTLDWMDTYQGGSASHSASYALAGTDLRRTYDGTTHTVASNVAEVEISLQGKLVTVVLTSTSEQWDMSKQVTHYFFLRPF